MTNVIDFAPRRIAEQPHTSGPAHCIACQHAWVAIAPMGQVWLECPECHSHRGLFDFRCGRDAAHWNCKCENNLFHLTPEGAYCPNCGSWQNLKAVWP